MESRHDPPPRGAPQPLEERPSTILVAEDEVLIRMPVADYLRDCGYRVIEAASAAEALEVFRSGEPVDIVFTDVQMPGDMNGFGLAAWIRREHPDVKVILTSGLEKMAQEARAVCEDGPFLEKPYDYTDLVAHIRRLLRREASTQETPSSAGRK